MSTTRSAPQSAEGRHRDLLNPIIDQLVDFGVCILDTDGIIVSVSDGVRDFLGYEERELIGLHAEVLFTPEDRAAGLLRHEMQGVREHGPAENRRWGVRKDGGRVFVDGKLLGLYDADGALEGYAKVMRDVTEQTQAEDALRHSELRYRTLFDAIDEGFCIIEVLYNGAGKPVDYRFLETNPAFHQHTGIAADARQTIRHGPGAQEFWFDAAAGVLEAGEPLRFEARTLTPPRWFDVRAWRLGGGANAQVAVIFSDITERKTSEASLRASEERYRALFDLMPVAVYACDPDGVIQVFNQRAAELWGREPKLGDPQERYCGSHKLFHPDGRPMAHDRSPMARTLQGEVLAAGDFEIHIERPDGTRRSVVAVPRLIRNAQGQVVGAINGLYDVTERTLSENVLRAVNESLEELVRVRTEELQSSEVRFQQAFELAPVPACITSLDEERILEVNRSFCQLTGYTRVEVIGRTAFELRLWSPVPDADAPGLGEAGEHGTGYRELPMELRTKDGSQRHILVSGEKTWLNDGQAWLRMFVDVTERQRTQEELMKAIQEVMSDASWFSSSVVQRLAELRKPEPAPKPLVELSRRERQVLAQMASGRTDSEIAEELGISRLTVRNYVASVYGKIDVHSRAEAVVWARERGVMG